LTLANYPMKVNSAIFVKSSADYAQCPPMDKPEYAFIGRSNVGKSSLINAITNHSKLAKTSSTPGKTQLINHFLINDNWYLVDLPGYGFAKISKEIRQKWEVMLSQYLFKRLNLINTFILVDSRIEPQKSDLELMSKYGASELPFTLIFTKSDKLTTNKLEKNLTIYKNILLKQWESLPEYIITSSESKRGIQDVLNIIEQSNPLFDPRLIPYTD